MLTYPRTNSRFLPTDMIARDQADRGAGRARSASTREAAAYVHRLDVLPLGRVINDAKVTDHHAIIPTNSEHKLDKLSDDDRRIYDMVARRFLAVFHPDAVFENTRLETTVAEHIFRTRGRVLMEAGWRGVYGEGGLDERRRPTTTTSTTSSSRSSSQGENVSVLRGRRPRRRSPSRRGATPTPRCWARWRPRASSSTTTRCARR